MALESRPLVLFALLVALAAVPAASAEGLVSHSVIYDVKPLKEDKDLYLEAQMSFTLTKRCDGWALGEIFQFEVVDPKRSLMELRSILDWQIAPRLKEVPGVVEINSYGGELKTYEVELRPEALVAYGLSLQDVFHARVSTYARQSRGI